LSISSVQLFKDECIPKIQGKGAPIVSIKMECKTGIKRPSWCNGKNIDKIT
jgi:hypothetical protein